MNPNTKQKFKSYLKAVEKANQIDNASEKFTVSPEQSQILKVRLQESADFLPFVNYMRVENQQGELVKLSSRPIASRTNTKTGGERKGKNIANGDAQKYQCEKIDFDALTPYATLDQWAHNPDFNKNLSEFYVKQQALDLQKIGFLGTHYAETTDLKTYPNLEDVAKGWLQEMRDTGNSQYQKDIKIGLAAEDDYKNLDALVLDSVTNFIAKHQSNDQGLRVICSRRTLMLKYLDLANESKAAADREATDNMLKNKSLGGMQVIIPSFFPDNAILITRPDNLSIYDQFSQRRRHLIEEPSKDGITNYESANIDFCVEEKDCAVLLELKETEE